MTVRISAAVARRLQEVRARQDAAAPKRRNGHPEADFQRALVVQLRQLEQLRQLRALWWSASLNGVRLSTEAARRKSKEQGANGGLSDLVFLGEDREVYMLELKAPTVSGRAEAHGSPEQKALAGLMKPGHYRFAKTVDEALQALRGWGLL